MKKIFSFVISLFMINAALGICVDSRNRVLEDNISQRIHSSDLKDKGIYIGAIGAAVGTYFSSQIGFQSGLLSGVGAGLLWGFLEGQYSYLYNAGYIQRLNAEQEKTKKILASIQDESFDNTEYKIFKENLSRRLKIGPIEGAREVALKKILKNANEKNSLCLYSYNHTSALLSPTEVHESLFPIVRYFQSELYDEEQNENFKILYAPKTTSTFVERDMVVSDLKYCIAKGGSLLKIDSHGIMPIIENSGKVFYKLGLDNPLLSEDGIFCPICLKNKFEMNCFSCAHPVCPSCNEDLRNNQMDQQCPICRHPGYPKFLLRKNGKRIKIADEIEDHD